MTAAPTAGQLSAAKRALLAQRLRAGASAGPALPRLPAGAPVPPSFAQERMWFLEQFAPGTTTYSLSFGVRLRGPLDTAALGAAVQSAARRHDVLRMSLSTADGAPVVTVADAVTVPWEVVDAADVAQAQELLAAAARVPFDLTMAPLLRATLVRLGPHDHVLGLLTHHIVSDGWSCGLLLADLAAAYRAAVTAAPEPAAPAVRYGDYAAWQRDRLAGPSGARDLAYWRGALAGVPPLELPTDRPRPAQQGFAGAGCPVRLDAELTGRLRRLGRDHDATLFMALLAGVQALLSRYAGATDFAIGIPVAGRVHPELENVLGLFTNTLAIRAQLGGDPSFTDLLARVRERVLDALAHQELPFERLVQELGLTRDVSRSPVFQVMFALQNYADGQGDWPGLSTEPLGVRNDTARFEVSLYLHEHPGGIDGWLVYNTDLFDAGTAHRLAGHLPALLAAAVADPTAPLSELDLLGPAERERVLGFGRPAAQAGPAPIAARTLADLIAPFVAATPDAPAVVCGPDRLSYAELDRRVGRLAGRLRAAGVGREARVAVLLEQSVDLAVAVLAVLRAGGAYLPLDPEQPPARLAHLLGDAAPAAVLTRAALRDRLPADPDRPVVLVGADEPGGPPPDPTEVRPGDLAYVIYTSGSTGRPKGVAVAHEQVLRYLDGVCRRFEVAPGARFALPQSLAFDFSVTTFYLALATGGVVHLVPRRGTGAELADYLRRHRIDYLKITPSHLAALAADEPPGALIPARALILGGEASTSGWSATLARQAAARGATVFNHYGPTETTVGVTTLAVPSGDGTGGATPIGRPLTHARIYVLNGRGQPAPVGVPGEIHVGGDQLARGYLGQPGLTASRFRPDPYGPPGARMYRTGDLGRWDADGRLHFLGRADQQVKVRGYRVEPGEVEAALAGCPGVGQAVVVLRGDRLVGYLEPGGGQPPAAPAEIRRTLAERLPDYLVPARLVWLARLPLQEHGKVDRRALPEPPPETPTGDHEPPRGPVEEAIAGVWAQALGLARVGATDDFFELGGHSLLATRVVARLRRALPEVDRPISVMDLFQHRTVRELAELTRAARAEDRLLHELTRPSPTRIASLICVPYGGASAVVYQPLADALPPGYALHAVAVPGHDIGTAGDTAPIGEVAQRCVAEILADVDGPLIVYGHCGPGGALAVEIARRLEAAGRDPDAVYLGGVFPFARPTGGLLGPLLKLRLAERMRGDRVHANWLRAMGADLSALDEEQTRFLIRAMRHDAVAAEDFFTDLLHQRVAPLRAPIISVVGDQDPGVEFYQERYREWHFLAGTTGLVVLAEGGHYFLKFRADELARIVTTVHRRLAVPPDLPEPDADATWRLAAVSHTADDAAAPAPAAVPAAAGPRPSMRRFLAVASGQMISMIGTAFTEFAIPLHIYLTTGSVIRFALFAVLGVIPGMLVAPFAGALVDRFSRRAVVLAGDLSAGSLALGLATLAWTGPLRTWHLYGFVAALSVALAFQRIAFNSAVPQLVPKQYLGHANGVLQVAAGTAQFLVPLLAVGAMAVIGLRGILLLDVASYAFAIAVVACLRFPRTMAHRRREGLLREIAGGFRYSVGQRAFRAMLAFFAVLNIFLAPLFLLVSPLVLALAPLASVGHVALAGGAGGILGGIVMLVWGGPRRNRMRGVLIASLGVAAGAVLTGLDTSLVVIGVGVFAMSLALSVLNGVYATIIQTKVPQRLHGRVIALNTVAAWSTLPLGWAVMAPLATSVAEPLLRDDGALAPTVGLVLGTGPGRGIALAYLAFAACIAAVVTVSLRTPVLARFDREVPDAPPDDVVGLETLRSRLSAKESHHG